jgi:hypothetical protein
MSEKGHTVFNCAFIDQIGGFKQVLCEMSDESLRHFRETVDLGPLPGNDAVRRAFHC